MLGSGVFRLCLQKNRDVPGVEAYVRASDTVQSRLGTVEKISITGMTSVAASTSSPGHMIYKVFVSGSEGSDTFKIYVTYPSSGRAVLTEQPPRSCGVD